MDSYIGYYWIIYDKLWSYHQQAPFFLVPSHFSAALTRSHTTLLGTPTRPKGLVQSHLHGKSLKMGDPKVTIGFNTESWSSITWIWAYPYDLGIPKWAFFKILLAVHYTGWLRTEILRSWIIISPCNSPIYWLAASTISEQIINQQSYWNVLNTASKNSNS